GANIHFHALLRRYSFAKYYLRPIMKKKVKNAWAFYDWANSVYSLVISTAIFPIYFNSVTSIEGTANEIDFLGFSLPNTTLYSYSLSFSFIIVALISPFLSGIA